MSTSENEQVVRNIDRFRERFMFQLETKEFANLKLQIVTSSWGVVRKPSRMFTEHGVAMLASVLRSETAVWVSLAIIDASIAKRRPQIANAEVFKRIETVGRRQIAERAQNEEWFKLDRLLHFR